MKLYFILAWRNIWRNRRRTLIAASSVFFAVLLAIIMRSIQYGSYDFMIDSAVRLYTGYLQIHGKGYWEVRSLEKSIYADEISINKIEKLNHVELAVPRLENFMLISSKEITKVASIICIEPDKENSMTRLKEKLIKGNYLNHSDEGILISEGLAKLLNVDVGDSVILYGQGLYGTTAAANCRIIGIVKFAIPDLNNSFVYMPLNFGQTLFSMEGKITTVSIMLNNPRMVDAAYNEIKKIIGDEYEIMKWDEMMPELVQGIQLDNVSGLIMLAILYLIITFGIFGTVMIMAAERTKEFGILISIGLKKSKLIFITTIESIFISFIGALSGLAAAVPVVSYYHHNPIKFTGELAEISLKFGVEPIIPFSTDAGIFIAQTLVVLLISLISAVYPFNFIRKLQPVDAMRV